MRFLLLGCVVALALLSVASASSCSQQSINPTKDVCQQLVGSCRRQLPNSGAVDTVVTATFDGSTGSYTCSICQPSSLLVCSSSCSGQLNATGDPSEVHSESYSVSKVGTAFVYIICVSCALLVMAAGYDRIAGTAPAGTKLSIRRLLCDFSSVSYGRAIWTVMDRVTGYTDELAKPKSLWDHIRNSHVVLALWWGDPQLLRRSFRWRLVLFHLILSVAMSISFASVDLSAASQTCFTQVPSSQSVSSASGSSVGNVTLQKSMLSTVIIFLCQIPIMAAASRLAHSANRLCNIYKYQERIDDLKKKGLYRPELIDMDKWLQDEFDEQEQDKKDGMCHLMLCAVFCGPIVLLGACCSSFFQCITCACTKGSLLKRMAWWTLLSVSLVTLILSILLTSNTGNSEIATVVPLFIEVALVAMCISWGQQLVTLPIKWLVGMLVYNYLTQASTEPLVNGRPRGNAAPGGGSHASNDAMASNSRVKPPRKVSKYDENDDRRDRESLPPPPIDPEDIEMAVQVDAKVASRTNNVAGQDAGYVPPRPASMAPKQPTS